jgi:hypothetical protein
MASSKGLLAVVAVAGLLAACSAGPKQAASESKAAPGSAAVAVSAGDFGVPECDSFMKKYIACIDSKVPDAARGPFRQAMEQQKTALQQAASTPQGKAALAEACTRAEATAKQSMSAYSCQW